MDSPNASQKHKTPQNPAAIYDLSATKDTTIPVEIVRGYARRRPPVPMGRPHVVVGKAPAIFGLARIFQMCREDVHGEFEVVHTMEEAYKIVKVRPEDFMAGWTIIEYAGKPEKRKQAAEIAFHS